MNLLEAMILLHESTKDLPHGKPLDRARQRIFQKIAQLKAQRARRKPTGEIFVTAMHISGDNPHRN